MPTVFAQTYDELEPWILDELCHPGDVARGDVGADVRRVQEWLSLDGHAVVVDGDFGPATKAAVIAFQSDAGCEETGAVDATTWARLVAPLAGVLTRRCETPCSFGDAVLAYAQAHLDAGAREVGGPNAGPWVRLYLHGHDGPAWAWCAGFVSFLVHQAADSLAVDPPLAGSPSCDVLATQASESGAFLAGGVASYDVLAPGTVFFVRRTEGDWTHTGLVVDAAAESFTTIEGNTNDAGDREGYEVCARTRGYTGKDFALL